MLCFIGRDQVWNILQVCRAVISHLFCERLFLANPRYGATCGQNIVLIWHHSGSLDGVRPTDLHSLSKNSCRLCCDVMR